MKLDGLVKHVFRIYDVNNDGSIDFLEFAVRIAKQLMIKQIKFNTINSDGLSHHE